MEKIILFIYLLLFSIQSFGTVLVSGEFNEPLNSHFVFYPDKTGELNLEEIKKKKFDKTNPSGFYKGNVWAKVKICNPNNEPVHFIYKDPIETIKIYSESSSIPVKYQKTNQNGFSNDYWVDLDLKIHNCETIWLMFNSGDAMSFSASLVSSGALKRMMAYYNFFYAAYYSFLVIVFLISCVFLFKYKDKVYFYFCSLLITQDFLGTSLLNGFLFYYALKPIDSIKYDVGNIFALLMNISVVAFAMAFLKENNKFNKIISELFIMSQAILVTPLLINLFVHIHIQNPTTSYLVNQSILFGFFWVFYLGIINFSSTRGKIFVLASSPKLLGQIVKTLLLQGNIPENLYFFSTDMSFILFNISAIGSLYEAILIIVFLINSYIKNIENKTSELKEAMLKLKQSEIDSALMDLSKQLAHDIRSPLLALEFASATTACIPEEKRIIIRQASQRIKDISNNLLINTADRTNHSGENPLSVWLVSNLVETIISEKRAQFYNKKDIKIISDFEENSYGLFARINASDFKRVLSNLINNSVEAMENNQGIIRIGLCKDDKNTIIISIEDNGKGMSIDTLNKAGQKGFSFGKEGQNQGFGLGLSHAISTIESWNGTVKMHSEKHIGTKISTFLPQYRTPGWFLEKLSVEEKAVIIILDDDLSIHQIWQNRFNEKPVTFVNITNPELLNETLKKYEDKQLLVLCDYEFIGYDFNGLDLIKELKIQKYSILVTSHLDECDIQKECENIELKCIPKELACYVPIEIISCKETYDAILIDDDTLMHQVWEMSAKINRKALKIFQHPRDFLKDTNKISQSTVIFLDSHFNDCKGESFVNEIYNLGFKSIYLCTGFAPSNFKANQYLLGIKGKEPYWPDFHIEPTY